MLPISPSTLYGHLSTRADPTRWSDRACRDEVLGMKLTVPEVIERIRMAVCLASASICNDPDLPWCWSISAISDKTARRFPWIFSPTRKGCAVASSLRLSDGTACDQARGPRGGLQVRVTDTDRQAFHDRFISFRTLGVRARLDWDTLRQRLEAGGIVPAGVRSRIYHRRDVADLPRSITPPRILRLTALRRLLL